MLQVLRLVVVLELWAKAHIVGSTEQIIQYEEFGVDLDAMEY